MKESPTLYWSMSASPGAFVEGWAVAMRRPKTRAAVRAFQSRRLRRVVHHAYNSVPYYRRLFDSAGLTPTDIRSLEDLPKIPLTSRDDIQFLPPEQICARGSDLKSLLVRRTSGSSGAPLTIRRRRVEERLLQALRLSYTRDYGGSCRSRRAEISYLAGKADWNSVPEKPPIHQRLGFYRRLILDWNIPKDEMIGRLTDSRTEILVGAPSALCWKADELTDLDRERLNIRYVITGGETLTPDLRVRLERGWGASVHDTYGSHEFVFIANQQPGGEGYRVCGESLIVEVLRDGKPAAPGEEGELVGTALHSFVMPFIRYRLGDLVQLGEDEDPADFGVSTLLRINGRTMERFFLPGGRVVHPYAIANLLRDQEPWLRRFQITQPERDRLHIRIVPLDTPGPDRLQQTARRIEGKFEGSVSVALELVNELPPTAGGKFQPYLSYEQLLRAKSP